MIIYCDGASRGNPGEGGWGVYIQSTEEKIYGYVPDVTNNYTELLSAIVAAYSASTTEETQIYSDSQYVIKGMNEWLAGWKKKNWVNAKKEPVKNKELWLLLDGLSSGKDIKWKWVRGHNGSLGNDMADKLANSGADGCFSETAKSILNTIFKKEKSNIVFEDKKLLDVEVGEMIYELNSESVVLILDKSIEDMLIAYNLDNEEKIVVPLEKLKNYRALKEKSIPHYKRALNFLKKENQKNNDKYYELMSSCPHDIKSSSYESAICNICGTDFGWYCEESPDHCCYYYTNSNGMIELNDGTIISPPKDHDTNYETHDCCIFCGAPEERK